MSAREVTHDMSGKVCLVTGANTGIGRVTAVELARAGARVFIACRSRERAEPVLEEIRREARAERGDFLDLDLGSLASVRACATDFLARGLPLHVLVNNAGVAGQRGQTKDGFELQFGVNHLGHFLLTRLLLERIEGSAPARIVNVSSHSHYRARGIDFEAQRQSTRSVTGLPEYEASKLANVLFTKELARRLDAAKVTTYALHPGTVASDIWKRIPAPFRFVIKAFLLTTAEGAMTTLHCATAPALAVETGRYYVLCREKHAKRSSDDTALAAELWRKSEAWSGL